MLLSERSCVSVSCTLRKNVNQTFVPSNSNNSGSFEGTGRKMTSTFFLKFKLKIFAVIPQTIGTPSLSVLSPKFRSMAQNARHHNHELLSVKPTAEILQFEASHRGCDSATCRSEGAFCRYSGAANFCTDLGQCESRSDPLTLNAACMAS